eukprot:scaffold74786_cov41-Phaeocystis_antarctica.AAC.2
MSCKVITNNKVSVVPPAFPRVRKAAKSVFNSVCNATLVICRPETHTYACRDSRLPGAGPPLRRDVSTEHTVYGGGAGGSIGFSVRYQGQLLGIWDLQNRDPRRKSPPETEKSVG